MDVNTFKVLDYVYKHPNAWLEMSLTSNMVPPKPILMDMFIEKLQRLEEIQIWEDPEKFNPNSGNNWYVAPAWLHGYFRGACRICCGIALAVCY